MAKKPAPAEKVVAIDLPPLKIQHMTILLVGDSPLISHAWSHKAKAEMLAKHMQKAKQPKAAKVPEDDFRESLYPHPDGGYGFPAVAFKSAAVSACRFADMKMTNARGAFHVLGELVRIEGEPTMREDMVRLNGTTPDVRFRGEFKVWKALVTVRFNAGALSAEQIVNLFNTAGFGVGVGEWRPERNGSYGMFHVGSDAEASA